MRGATARKEVCLHMSTVHLCCSHTQSQVAQMHKGQAFFSVSTGATKRVQGAVRGASVRRDGTLSPSDSLSPPDSSRPKLDSPPSDIDPTTLTPLKNMDQVVGTRESVLPDVLLRCQKLPLEDKSVREAHQKTLIQQFTIHSSTTSQPNQSTQTYMASPATESVSRGKQVPEEPLIESMEEALKIAASKMNLENPADEAKEEVAVRGFLDCATRHAARIVDQYLVVFSERACSNSEKAIQLSEEEQRRGTLGEKMLLRLTQVRCCCCMDVT